ncbi:beta-D-glucosyl crocetin beta-1,6-glucosyltransferase [Artemisia annua]|uniref:Glycosyltransferase n=1 Tax=Artemisia annua TaxID=35608 RepID=A0A2U1LD17_ARTAN|nr:beta-D-glucosyl crocetin beta-1,6-glucosyltransferase [Artemisia annua]
MSNSNLSLGRKQNVLMFPWLGHGHVSPFLQLAKKLIKTNHFNIYLCSTPANLNSIRQVAQNESISLIELNLTPLPGLPAELHTTNALPSYLMATLKRAFDNASPNFAKILLNLKPDLLIYDMIQPWAAEAAAAIGIPSVLFITTSATMASNMFHLYKKKGNAYPFKSIYYRAYEYWNVKEVLESEANGRKDKDRVEEGVENSSSIVLAKSFKEIEGKYADYFTELTGKRVVPVGPLVVDPLHVDNEQNNVIEWLDTKTPGSTVFISFGSEYFLSEADLKEIAKGLELSNVNFIWVLRFPRGHWEGILTIEQALPQGFLERVQNRGLVVEGWAPQAKILAHKNIGGFVSHCGWSSVMEAMKFGVPIIAMPMHLDQPVNARLVVELGLGKEVLRDGNGVLMGHKVAEVVDQVVFGKLGEDVRAKAKKMSLDLKIKGDEEIDVVADELLQLCSSAQARRVVGGLYKTRSEAFVLGKSWAVKGHV